MFDARFRTAVDRVVSPAGRALRRTGLSPDHLTAVGILMAVPAALAIATGRLVLGIILVIASALPDLFDGSLAKATGRTSQRGAFFDSVGDRVSDLVVLAGMAWYAQDRFHGHAALVPLAVLGAGQLVSYIRAKADALGIDAKNGLMERGERIFVLCFALKFPADMMQLLWLVFALSMVTAAQRFVRVWRLADKPPKPEPAAVVVRWRAWREGRAGEASWWAPAARARRGTGPSAEGGLVGRPFSNFGTGRGFFSGSRRPSGAAARRHERRLERRQRMKAEEPGREPHDAGEELHEDREGSTRWRPPSTGQV